MLSLMTAGAQTELLIPPEVVASSLPNPATPKTRYGVAARGKGKPTTYFKPPKLEPC